MKAEFSNSPNESGDLNDLTFGGRLRLIQEAVSLLVPAITDHLVRVNELDQGATFETRPKWTNFAIEDLTIRLKDMMWPETSKRLSEVFSERSSDLSIPDPNRPTSPDRERCREFVELVRDDVIRAFGERMSPKSPLSDLFNDEQRAFEEKAISCQFDGIIRTFGLDSNQSDSRLSASNEGISREFLDIAAAVAAVEDRVYNEWGKRLFEGSTYLRGIEIIDYDQPSASHRLGQIVRKLTNGKD